MCLALTFENVCQPIPSAASPLAAQDMSGAPGDHGGATGGEMGGASVQDIAWSGMGGAPLAGQDKFAGDGTHFGGLLHYSQGLVGDVNSGHKEMALSTYPPVVQHAHAQELCCRV
jgi:hypothetical protein